MTAATGLFYVGSLQGVFMDPLIATEEVLRFVEYETKKLTTTIRLWLISTLCLKKFLIRLTLLSPSSLSFSLRTSLEIFSVCLSALTVPSDVKQAAAEAQVYAAQIGKFHQQVVVIRDYTSMYSAYATLILAAGFGLVVCISVMAILFALTSMYFRIMAVKWLI